MGKTGRRKGHRNKGCSYRKEVDQPSGRRFPVNRPQRPNDRGRDERRRGATKYHPAGAALLSDAARPHRDSDHHREQPDQALRATVRSVSTYAGAVTVSGAVDPNHTITYASGVEVT
jgi:hypothetical protein